MEEVMEESREYRGRDRSSEMQVGDFILITDKDHKGFYRGNQAMEKTWRGWHYHVESVKYSQEQICRLIEVWLRDYNANQFQRDFYAIGNLEKPAYVSAWEKFGKTIVLWISSYNGKLHIEANKENCNCKSLITKAILKKILHNKRFS